MKTIYYATKIDKSGNKITIGYQTEKNRKKYSENASWQDGRIYADFNEEGKLALYDYDNPNRAGYVMHGMLVNSNAPMELSEGGNGDFALYGKRNNAWFKTPFSFPTYSAASTAMKAMIAEYQALLVRNDGPEDEKATQKVELESGAELTIGE